MVYVLVHGPVQTLEPLTRLLATQTWQGGHAVTAVHPAVRVEVSIMITQT